MCRADRPPSRRAFLDVTGVTVAAGLLAGSSGDAARSDRSGDPAPSASATPTPVAVTGRHQAGVTLPRSAQPHLLALVADLGATVLPGPLLAELGETIRTLAAGSDPRLLGLSPGDVTVTVGVGPRLVRTAGATLPGAEDLPRFSRERVASRERGGDLLIQICAGDALFLPVAAAALLDQAGDRIQER